MNDVDVETLFFDQSPAAIANTLYLGLSKETSQSMVDPKLIDTYYETMKGTVLSRLTHLCQYYFSQSHYDADRSYYSNLLEQVNRLRTRLRGRHFEGVVRKLLYIRVIREHRRD